MHLLRTISPKTLLAVGLALLAALLFAGASVLQQRAASSESADEVRGLGLIARLIRRPMWLAGGGADVGAYVAQAAALGFGSLLVVQPLLATTLLFALPLEAKWNARRVSAHEIAWALVLAAGLAIFLGVAHPSAGTERAARGDWMVPLAIVGVPTVALMLWGMRSRPTGKAVCFGIASGALFGVMSALTKSAVSEFDGGLAGVLTSWEPYGVALTAVLGLTLQQSAYQAGGLAFSLPAIAVFEPLVASLLGVSVLGEVLHVGSAGWALVGVSCVGIVASLVALPRAAARSAGIT